jgi:hypothetical protein
MQDGLSDRAGIAPELAYEGRMMLSSCPVFQILHGVSGADAEPDPAAHVHGARGRSALELDTLQNGSFLYECGHSRTFQNGEIALG